MHLFEQWNTAETVPYQDWGKNVLEKRSASSLQRRRDLAVRGDLDENDNFEESN